MYQYHPTRSADVPKKFLKEYTGIVQTDGYGGYDFTDKNYTGTITHVGCLAHARRYFEKAYKTNKKSNCAHQALKYIRDIYRVKSSLRERNLGSDEFVNKRKEQVESIIEKFHNWLGEQQKIILPSSPTGKAISYTLGEWEKIICFLDHHLLTPDNNKIENAIRPFVICLVARSACCSAMHPCRKNWLFSNTPRGARSSACFYSCIESANPGRSTQKNVELPGQASRANKLEPYYYLRYVFGKLPGCKNREELRTLLPDMVSPDMIQIS